MLRPAASFSCFICYISLGRNQNALFRACFLGSLCSCLGNRFPLINNESYTYCALAYLHYRTLTHNLPPSFCRRN